MTFRIAWAVVAVSAAGATLVAGGIGIGSSGKDRAAAPRGIEGARAAALALGSDGASVVAYVRGRTLVVSRVDARGTWRRQASVQVPRAGSYRLQLVVGRGDRATVLVQDGGGRWLGVADGARWRLLDRRAGLGAAGIALDGHGRVVVASAYSTGPQTSYLRLLRPGARGPEAITRLGFPGSTVPPAATPVVLPGGRLHVVESFGQRGSVGGIEWGRQSGEWWGQNLASAALDRSVGPVSALVGRSGTLYSAWTAKGFGQDVVVLARRHGDVEESTLVQHASLGALAVGPRGPEIAVNRASGTADLLVGGLPVVTVPGRVLGLVERPGGGRTLLVTRHGRLSLVRIAAAPGSRGASPGRQV